MNVAHQLIKGDCLRLLLQSGQIVGGHIDHILQIFGNLYQHQIPEIPGKIRYKLRQLTPLHYDFFQKCDTSGHITVQHIPKQIAEHTGIHRPQHIQGHVIGELISQMKGDALIQQTQRITHGAIRRFGNIPQRLILHLHLLPIHQLPHAVRNGVNGNPLKIIPLAAGQDRYGKLMHIRGSQNKNHIGGRLLQCLQ